MDNLDSNITKAKEAGASRPKFNERGERMVYFEPSPRQYILWQKLHDKQSELILAGGAAGGGKSYTGSIFLITQALQYADTRWVVGRMTLKSLRESTLNTILSILEAWDIKFNFNQITLDITFQNGSKIILKELASTPSDPNFERFGSSEYTGAFIDEVSEVSDKAVDVLRSRLRWKVAKYGLIPKLLMSTNPTINWVRSRFVQDDDGNPVKLKSDEAYVPFTVYDNPDKEFRELYIRGLENIRDAETKSRLLHGNWNFVSSNDAAFYSGFDGAVHLRTSLKEQFYDRTRPLHVTFDFNVFPFLSCLICQIDANKKKIYVLEEVLGRPPKANKTAVTARMVTKKYSGHMGGVLVYGDPSGKKRDTRSEEGFNDFTIIIRELRKLRPSTRVPKSAPPVHLRGEWINEIFENNLDGWEILIDMRCRRFTEDLIYGLADEDGGKDKTKVRDEKTGVRYEKYHHLSDAFDYFITMALQKSWLKYKKGGKASGSPVTSRPSYNKHTY